MSARQITIWEVHRRIDQLVEFRRNVVRYFNNTKTDRHSFDEPVELDDAREARSQINQTLEETLRNISDTGVATVFRWSPPPAVGGYVKDVNLIQNLFNLHRLSISPQFAIDIIEQAIGVYESEQSAARRRTLNPFFWLGRFLRIVSALPFSLLEHAGLHGRRLEESFFGRVLRLATEVIAVLTALFGFLKLVGREELLTQFFK